MDQGELHGADKIDWSGGRDRPGGPLLVGLLAGPVLCWVALWLTWHASALVCQVEHNRQGFERLQQRVEHLEERLREYQLREYGDRG